MIRLVLAALVFCSTLCAALGQSPAGSPAAQESSFPASAAHALLDCTPAEDDGEWRPQHDATASIPESPWKWRTLHAGVSATVRPGAVVANALPNSPPARTNGAPSYLLHTPLLI